MANKLMGQLALLREISEKNVPVVVHGGCAREFLLNGGLKEDHYDVDLLVKRADLDKIGTFFRNAGYETKPAYNTVSDSPFKYHMVKGEVTADVGIVDKDGKGEFFTVTFPGKTIKIYLDRGAFDYPPLNSEGIKISVVAPKILVQITKAFALSGETKMRPPDLEQMDKLAKKFFPEGLENIQPHIDDYSREIRPKPRAVRI